MAISKGTIAKEIDGIVEYVYPKTSSDIVEYTPTQSVKDKLDSIDSNIQNNYYTKNEINTIISQLKWTGTLKQYQEMPSHTPGKLYITIDDKNVIRQFLGDIEIKDNTITIGESILMLIGTNMHKIGICKGVEE